MPEASKTRRRFKGRSGECDPACVREDCSPILACLVPIDTPTPTSVELATADTIMARSEGRLIADVTLDFARALADAAGRCEGNKEHCWHELDEVLTVCPPIYTDHCCFCNASRERSNRGEGPHGHGPHV